MNNLYLGECSDDYKNTNSDILVNTVRFFTNLRNIIINIFSPSDEVYLNSLILYFSSNVKLLNNIKKLNFIGAKQYYNNCYYDDIITLNTRLLKLFFHRNLEHLILNINIYVDVQIIQEILNNATELKKIKLTNRVYSLNLSFENQKKLTSVKFYSTYNGTIKTLKSLYSCAELQVFEFHIFRNINEIQNVKKFLMNATSLINLKTIKIPLIKINTDEELIIITKNFPNLECLCCDFFNLTNFEILGINCPNIKSLEFQYNLTNDDIKSITSKLPKLEVLLFDDAKHITKEGIIHIAQNCSLLKVLQFCNYSEINNLTIITLVNNCSELISINFSYGGIIEYKNLEYLLENLPKLKYATFNDIRDITDDHINTLKEKYKNISFNPSLLKNKY